MSGSSPAAGLSPEPRADGVRILIVDDSAVARAVLGRMIEGMRGFQVVGAVSTVAAALSFLAANRADVILLDLEMPGVHGLTGLPDLLAAGRGARVLVVSSSAERGAAAAVQALALGAADTLEKPGVGSFSGKFAQVLEERLTRLTDRTSDPVGPALAARAVPQEFDIVAVGASTGGIHALSQMLRAIPPSFEVPILVTQHLPASFMSYFAAQLAVLSGRPCEVAEDAMRVRPGRMLVAPGHAHIRCVRGYDGIAIRLTDERAASGCMPSVDPMLESIADVYGKRGLGVVLSGMGRDGAAGARALVDAGGAILAQDRATSVVWGMPGAIAASASAVLPPDEIGRVVASQRRPR
ncbi:two-component system chemotaxis response regulator CheB [Sphingomonas sp. BE123]|uniref:chemotaxis protein CheB n=1 Tax=unclassified Sphingomonas TaxID=196159 RepID=UPI00285CC69C|nr:chemotaxis protein CheB [Sphingomonas sp. BE123]MDR6851317.1 two-component system chemotaxis response regulator CheB [Sphingomonas sp. BE123]